MDYTLTVDPARALGEVNPLVFGHFIEHLGRCIYGGVYEPGSPLADERGFRTDVLAAMRKIGVPVLRWPGGNFASNYHWEDGIGPRATSARRASTWPGSASSRTRSARTSSWPTATPSPPTQTPCRPYICLNTGTGTLDEAVRWLEYCNLDAEQATPPTTPGGASSWGAPALRRAPTGASGTRSTAPGRWGTPRRRPTPTAASSTPASSRRSTRR